MKSYRYIGPSALYAGHTAAGQFRGRFFMIQVDDLDHIHSHWWWFANREHWEER